MANSPRRPKADASNEETNQTVVKKYANRRLYNTATSSYVTLEELSQMVRDGHEFVVYDAKSGDDITRSVLTQIILEEDAKGRNLLPVSFLRQLIGFYDDNLHAFLPRYLEISMENFAKHQDQMRGYMGDAIGRMFPMSKGPMNQIEEMTRQNMAMFSAAANMFNPFPNDNAEGEERATSKAQPASPEPSSPKETSAAKGADLSDEMEKLKSEMATLRAQLRSLAKG